MGVNAGSVLGLSGVRSCACGDRICLSQLLAVQCNLSISALNGLSVHICKLFCILQVKDSVRFYFQDFVGRVRSEGGESAPGTLRSSMAYIWRGRES